MKIVVIASTNGSVLSKLLEVEYFKNKIEYIISDRECGAIEIAKQFGIKTKILLSDTGEEFSNKILKEFNVQDFDLYISFYTKLFKGPLLDRLKFKLINLHPSILPAFPGMDGFGDTLKSGVQFIGSTIHFIDKGIDTGLPIIQSAYSYNPEKSVEELRHEIFIDQCRSLLQVVKWFEEGNVEINNNRVVIKNADFHDGITSPKIDFEIARSFDVPFQKKEKTNGNSTLSLNKNILDLRNTTNHPYSLPYSEIYNNALVSGKLEHGRTQPGFSLKGNSPFVLAAKKAIDFGVNNDGTIEVIEEVMSDYYDHVVPDSAADWLGVKTNDKNQLNLSPPWAAVFPWRARTLESYRKAYESAAQKESKAAGLKLDISDGWLFCGPVSRNKLNIEAKRIDYVLRQIYNNGYKRWNSPEGDVKATALVNEVGDWRWLITAGNHRASAASALGYSEIPVRINLVISRNQVNYWPHIVNNLFTVEQALEIFDRFFHARVPQVAQNWDNIIKQKVNI